VSSKLHILLVEDTPSDIRLTKEALQDSGFEHELSVVNDGEQAIDFLNANASSAQKPDLLLLDLNMPKKNGHEVLEEMKDMTAYAETPVILLTVSQDDHDIAKALHLKMNYYLPKPVTSEKLEALLRAMQELASDSAAKLARGEDAHVRYVIAGNPHTASPILARLAVERNPTIRMRVAENRNTPLAVLEQLMEDPSAEVRAAIAENSNAPSRLLERLAKDRNEDVRLAVALNPRVPLQILRQLSIDSNGYVMSAAQKTLDALGAHPF
jgi:chemotaxis family two-component system response regulator Rcp1